METILSDADFVSPYRWSTCRGRARGGVWGLGGSGARCGKCGQGERGRHSPGRVRVGLELRVCGVWRRKLAMRVWAVGLGLG